MEEIPEFSEANLDTAEAMEEIPELPELDFAAAEAMEEIPELPELDFAAAEAMEETPEFSEVNLDTPEEDIDSEESMVVATSEIPEISSDTQLQIQQASLFHVQTSTTIEISQDLDVIHIGKPNSQIPPDINVSSFPNSDVVSRIHADIRVEGDTYFIEDVGSSNGTYINHIPLLRGNRYRLRTGDRIALGKGDLVTFIFQIK